MSKKAPLELLPVTIEGKVSFVKRGQYAKATAEAFALKLKADIKKAHVEAMLEAAESGKKELPGENPEEFCKVFAQVVEDVANAREQVAQAAADIAAVKLAAENAVKAAAKAEDDLFLSIKDETADFGTLAKTFDTGNMDRFIPKKEVSNKDLLIALNTGLKMGEFSNWMTGDLVKELEDRDQLNVVARLAESTGKAYSSIYNAAKTARAVAPDKRKGASFTAFAEIANARFSKDEAENKRLCDSLVDRAVKGELNTQEAREAVKIAKGVTPAAKVRPEENEKATFLIIDHTLGTIEITIGFPKELLTGDAVIVDPRTGTVFGSMKAKPDNRWKELPVYVNPDAQEEEVETVVDDQTKKKGKK